jgi:Cys-rich repeat protein
VRTNGGSAGATDGGLREGGDADGSALCHGACAGITPVCKAATRTCVQCTTDAHCPGAKSVCAPSTNLCVECTDAITCPTTKPLCDPTTSTCAQCLTDANCNDPANAQCSAGTCVPCATDATCNHVANRGICSAGKCVQCTVTDESPCAGKSCNPATNACTTTAVGSVGECKACLADSECVGGDQADPDYRCVPMHFQGVPRPGGFCLRRVAKTCAQPYSKLITTMSLSGAVTDRYCGIIQDVTRCEAVLDLIDGAPCAGGLDTSCGCSRDQNGNCTEIGAGGICRTVGTRPSQCTYDCGTNADCASGTTCFYGGATAYCQ